MTRPREGLRRVEAYRSPQPDAAIRLNTNECPYPLPEGFADTLAARVRSMPLHRYPDNQAQALRERLAARLGHHPDEVWVANGSNEVIHQLMLAYGGPGRTAVVFEPTYALHRRLSWIGHTNVASIRFRPPFDIDPDHVAEARRAAPDVVFVCSPNNPTGGARPVEVTEKIAADSDALVIVDEAYIEFGGTSAIDLVRSRPNVAVVRTFSKAFALAGARIGYCVASPDVVEDLRRVRLPYHVSALTQAAGLTALEHADDALGILDSVRTERDRLVRTLRRLDRVEVFPSDANFVLFRPPGPAREVWQGLLDRGVLIRDLSDVVDGCLRVTAGTPAEVTAFLEALAEVLR
ncbi:MAG: histidinol-phosphate transaminase [Actinomycetota bacterium]